MSPRGGDQTHERASEIEPNNVTGKKKENEAASRQTGFPPSLSIPPPLSVSSFLFFCFTVLRECHCTKQFGHVANYSMLWFDTSLACEGTSLPGFWSFSIGVCSPKFAVWRPLYSVFQDTKKRLAPSHMLLRNVTFTSFQFWNNYFCAVKRQCFKKKKKRQDYGVNTIGKPCF